MNRQTVFPLLVLAFMTFGATGCYHATIDTGLKPSSEVIEEPFASSWIEGLVPPSTLSTQAKCPHGVAKVETEHSFVNSLVGIITFGIYTPITIRVTCAAASTSMLEGRNPDFVVEETASKAEVQAVFARAIEKATAEDKPIFVRY